MWSGKLSFQKVKTALVLVGIVFFMTSFLIACGRREGSPLNPRNAPTYLAETPRLAWTQDGEHILFSSGRLLGVYVVDSAGMSVRSFPETAPEIGDFEQPGAFAPALSPDGSRVAYSVWLPQNSAAVETAAFDGSDVRRLTVVDWYRDEDGFDREPDGFLNLYPVWSPDGQQLAFVSNHLLPIEDYGPRFKSGHRFFVMDADGTNVRSLAPLVEAGFGPGIQWVRWSSNGSWLAFVGFELDEEGREVYGLYAVQPDGSGLTLIANTILAEMSPDGSRLAFVVAQTDGDGNTYLALQTARPDGTDLITVGKLEGTDVYNLKPSVVGGGRKTRRIYQPVWSPDGAWLAFVDDRGTINDERGIVVVRPDGSDLKAVMIHQDAGISPTVSSTARLAEVEGPGVLWTPDGEEVWTRDLAFAVRPDGSGLREVIPGGIPNVVRTAWSPDGSQLAVLTLNEVGRFKLLAVERNGAEPRELVRGDSSGLATIPEWQDTARDYAACSAGYVVPEPEKHPGLVQDCRTLITLRNALAGEEYLNWGRVHPIGLLSLSGNWLIGSYHETWTGVAVGGDPPRVQRLDLSIGGSNMDGLTGVIPPEIGDLTGLEYLILYGNSLTGEIPPELGNLRRLVTLTLTQNSLSGNIPPELGKLSNLEWLRLSGNNLSGCIPKTLSDSVTTLNADGLAYCE